MAGCQRSNPNSLLIFGKKEVLIYYIIYYFIIYSFIFTVMKVIIVDDERPAISILSSFVKKVPFLDLQLATTNAFEAIETINTKGTDVLLSDIQMPDITGIELIQSLEKPPMVIFTTAYEEYALKGYELDIVDYLVKPIRFERFLKAMNKAQRHFKYQDPPIPVPENNFIDIKVDYQTVRIPLDDILYVEGLKDYVKVFTKDKMFLTRLNLKGIESKLPSSQLMRIHRSYIVSMSKITAFNKSQIFIGNTQIPIGNSYQEKIMEKLRAC